jgi:hypothetical protein
MSPYSDGVEPIAWEALAGPLDAAVAASPDVDGFCSASDWVIPAAEGLLPGRKPLVLAGEAGCIALMRAAYPEGPVLQPLEASWGLACPVLGSDLEGLARALAARVGGEILMLCGLTQGSPRFAALIEALAPRYRLGLGAPTRRFVASLEGGLDGFLARRSANLRVSLKKARKRAAADGLRFEMMAVGPAEADAAYRRLLAVEAKSWKGRSGVGITLGEMRRFYHLMIHRLARRGAVRLGFLRRGDEDVAYIFGGVRGEVYRGLQFSFAAGLEAYSPGGLCQLEQVARLCDEGITRYDLGTEVEYKRRWGEIVFDTVTLLGFPR